VERNASNLAFLIPEALHCLKCSSLGLLDSCQIGGLRYRRIHDLLRPAFPGVNHKKVYRLYGAANLPVRTCKKVKRAASERVLLQKAQGLNEVWSMDFVSDSLSTGRRIKCLAVGLLNVKPCVIACVAFL
jgi:transposase InsO family protein